MPFFSRVVSDRCLDGKLERSKTRHEGPSTWGEMLAAKNNPARNSKIRSAMGIANMGARHKCG
jgi:hypothetical protein